ncbi:MAG: DUF4178 domain-containing protein [Neisseria sp.]|uniref:DUF4178 domain-containing protein n=1 Tax=Neisseria sp. TaxID=192066 RepID=UPI0026DC387B|nr:DUF4178 domain-containing protein [Neisseria sp.]MDO4641311.1 DUF4178 domain-containing protein [Neisseria sp.]
MSEPLFKTDCPSCGAPVHAHSATAVTLVCGYCHSMLVRHDGGITDTGRDSALLEDFSPLQIGTTGKLNTSGFTLIGRLQVRYDEGMWNEWYALFDDGSTGWLSEAGDLYVFTRSVGDLPADTPAFEDTRAGFSTITYQSKRFIASDVRKITLQRAAAEGELPFPLQPQSINRVSDWRWENVFLTLDYANNQPEGFLGRGVNLAELQLTHTRSDEQITESAGKLKGSRQSENCPNCGSPVHWINGITGTVVCPACGSELDTSAGKAELIQANHMRQAQEEALRLPLGSQGRINNTVYTVIGAVRKDELPAQDTFDALYGKPPSGMVPEGSWIEYLLYNPQAGFLWVVETSEGEWSLSETLNDWPRLDINGQPQGCPKLYDYGGRVSYAAGAFYWHVRQGDLNYYSDYKTGQNKLSAEYSAEELAWSKSTPVAYAQIAEWFQLKQTDIPKYTAQMSAATVSWTLVALMSGIFVILNLPTLVSSTDIIWSLIILAIGLFFLFKKSRGDNGEQPTVSAYLISSLIIIAFFTFFNYLSTAEDNTNSNSYFGTGTGFGGHSGGFSGGHK